MDFNSQLSRMKNLMTYGSQVNEDARQFPTCSLEYRAKAADGKTYGIIREGHRYYIKSASAGQEAIAESYQYLGGFNNKKDYMYESYAKALKNFELKMASINEAFDGNVNVQTLNPFRSNEVLVEGTKKMKNEIARQRQIMYNAAMLMNEESGIGKTPFASQPESKHENSGDEDTPFTQSVTPDMDFSGKSAGAPKSQSDPYGNGGKAPKGKDVQVKDSVAGAHPSGGKVARVNEGVEGETEHDPSELADLLKDNLVRFTFTKKDGSTRHACGTQNVEIAKEYGAAVPTGVQPERPGIIPFIDLDMKASDMSPEDVAKGRFWKSCREENVQSIDEVISVDEIMGGEQETPEIEGEDGETPAGLPDEGGVDEEVGDLEDEDELGGEEGDLGDEDEFDDEGSDEELADIESDEDAKEAAIADMKDEYGDDFIDMDEAEDDLEDADELDDLNDEDGLDDEDLELDGEDDFDEEPESEDEEDFDEDDFDEEPESEDEDDFDEEPESEDEDDFEEEPESEDEDDFEEEPESEDEDEVGGLDEAKMATLNRIARKVASRVLLREERLNDFGKHPGYRKKPFELPETGEDRNEHGKDWNDSSVYSEEPFGQSKGDSKPYSNALERDALAMKITDKVMNSVKGDAKKESIAMKITNKVMENIKKGSNSNQKNALAMKITDKIMESLKKRG